MSKHKIYDGNSEYVSCLGSFEKFLVKREKEIDMRKTTGSSRDRLESTGSITNWSIGIDVKIDWLVRTVKEMKDEAQIREK